MKTTFCLFILITTCCAATASHRELPVQKEFGLGVSKTGVGTFTWDDCVEGEFLHYVVFSYDGGPPRELGEPHRRYAKVTARGSRNPKADLYTGKGRPEIDLFASPIQIYQVEKDGELRTFSERVTFEEYRSFFKRRPTRVTAEALIEHVNALRAQKQ